MTISETATACDHASDEYRASASSLRISGTLTGIGIAILSATILVIRAYLPRVLYGDISTLNRIWPVVVFTSYTLLGVTALVSIIMADTLLHRAPTASMRRRIMIGAALMLANTGIVTYGVIPHLSRWLVGSAPGLAAMYTISSMLGVLGYICLLMHRASLEHREDALHVQLEADAVATAVDRMELSMLEAQIEPHFLFNTLAHIKRQCRIDTHSADDMLSALIDYLDRALPASRRNDWTIGHEMDLIQVYLNILAQRFGTRFRYTIEASDTCRAMRLPALTVATLVENAIRHGLSPKSDGGSVSINAELADSALMITVCDNGVGLRRTSGSGLGLATVRARLRTVFGERAELAVGPNIDAGVCASIKIRER